MMPDWPDDAWTILDWIDQVNSDPSVGPDDDDDEGVEWESDLEEEEYEEEEYEEEDDHL
jgi:hypothetical protein